VFFDKALANGGLQETLKTNIVRTRSCSSFFIEEFEVVFLLLHAMLGGEPPSAGRLAVTGEYTSNLLVPKRVLRSVTASH
jgi:hypothetical protein